MGKKAKIPQHGGCWLARTRLWEHKKLCGERMPARRRALERVYKEETTKCPACREARKPIRAARFWVNIEDLIRLGEHRMEQESMRGHSGIGVTFWNEVNEYKKAVGMVEVELTIKKVRK